MTSVSGRPSSGRAESKTLAERWVPLAFVLAISIVYRWPRLANPTDLHSDSAVVGLQAMHILRGEWSPFLWGSGYQTSVDSVIAAAFFAVLGPTPLALRLSTFLGFLALTSLVYATLRRHVTGLAAAVLVLPLVFTPSPVHTYVFSPPRQAALTLVFLSVFLFDAVEGNRRPALFSSLGAATLGFACFADPYALLFVPSIASVAVPAVLSGDRARRPSLLFHTFLGGAIGLAPFLWVLGRADSTHGVLSLTARQVSHNFGLFVHDCFPFLLSTKIYAPSVSGDWLPWNGPRWFRVIQVSGAVAFVGAVLSGGALAVSGRATRAVARFGALGSSMLPVAVCGFLLSVMPVDQFSARYLVAILLTAPFALAPVCELLGPRRSALVIFPYLVASAVGGFLGYGREGDELGPVADVPRDDDALLAALRVRGVRYGLADYWAAYRLTFLSREGFVVAPWHESQDRYPPYRALVAGSGVAAYVYDPLESLESLDARRALFASGETEYSPDFETLRIGRYTAFILRKDALRADAPRRVFAAAPP